MKRTMIAFSLFAALLAAMTSAPTVAGAVTGTDALTTIAGSGSPGFAGDAGPATAAVLNGPFDVAVAANGDVYFVDVNNVRVRMIDATTGNITTVAGVGTTGFSGDGGLATAAEFDVPRGLALDGSGNLYIADSGNDRIRMIDATTGNISTVAGVGTDGYSGDGASAMAAELDNPHGVAVDSAGDLYIADTDNHTIRKVDSTTGFISSVVGNGTQGATGDGGPAASALLVKPMGVTFAADDTMYIADTLNHRVRVVDPTTGNISLFAGTTAGYSGDDAAATAAQLIGPRRVAVASNGDVYIADTGNGAVRKVDATTGIITTVAGTGTNGASTATGAANTVQLNDPSGVALTTADNLLIADTTNHRVVLVTAADVTDPEITITSPTESQEVEVDTVVTADFACTDEGGSDIATCTGDLDGTAIATGDTIPTAEAGTATLTVTATDGAGNTATLERVLTIVEPEPEPEVCDPTLLAPYDTLNDFDAPIARLYMSVFARQPDAGGFDFWSTYIADGGSMVYVADHFVASDEFVETYGELNDDAFVELVYNNVMCRGSDAGGKEYWLGRLGNDIDRADLMRYFSDSPEFRIATGTNT